jgi:hypothetical protein
MMPSQEEIIHHQKLLAMYRSLLSEYLHQQALWDRTEVPSFLTNGISVIRRNILDVKGTLRAWKVLVSDHPDDEGLEDDVAEEVAHQRKILKIYRTNLTLYLNQQAQFDNRQVPAQIVNSIHQARTEIQRIKAILRSLNVLVDDLPDEDEP